MLKRCVCFFFEPRSPNWGGEVQVNFHIKTYVTISGVSVLEDFPRLELNSFFSSEVTSRSPYMMGTAGGESSPTWAAFWLGESWRPNCDCWRFLILFLCRVEAQRFFHDIMLYPQSIRDRDAQMWDRWCSKISETLQCPTATSPW